MDMTLVVVIGGAVILIVIGLMVLKSNSMSQAISKARETQDIQPILDEIDKDKSIDMASAFNVSIKSIWDAYDRELATELIKAFLKRDAKAPIAQHWLRQVLEIEPELARKQMGEAFVREHFHEEIAAQCGSGCGSCKS